MKIITINLPDKYLTSIQTLINEGKTPSRSEAVRVALRTFLPKELKFDEDLDNIETILT